MRKKILEKQILVLREIIEPMMPKGTTRRFGNLDGTWRYELPENTHIFAGESTNEEEAKEAPEMPVNRRAEILRTAEDLINGDRAQSYGAPEISFGMIADIWNAMGYRHHVAVKPDPETEPYVPGKAIIYKANKLDAVDTALILIGMKLSRTVGGRQQMDNWIDMAGYSGLGAELATPKDTEDFS